MQKQFNHLRIEYEDDLNIRLNNKVKITIEKPEISYEPVLSWQIFETGQIIDYSKI